MQTDPGCYTYSNSSRPGQGFRITRTSGPPVHAILTSSYTTASVNFVTWNKAYSIFPRQTLIDHYFAPLKPLDDGFGTHLKELVCQGWTARDIRWPDLDGAKARQLCGFRRVGDDSTLLVPLNTDSVEVPPTPDFVIEYTQFKVKWNSMQAGHGHVLFARQPNQGVFGQNQNTLQPEYSRLEILADELTSQALRHSYITASENWKNYLTDRLKRWVWLELYKIAPLNRPIQPLHVTPLITDASIPHNFELPKSWDYADDQIPKWFRELDQLGVSEEGPQVLLRR
ncbi:aldolase [Apiospora arundinis]